MDSRAAALSRVVGVEEHVTFPDLLTRLPKEAAIERGYLSADEPFGGLTRNDPMQETEARIQQLDKAGITVQVLSYPYAGADLLPPRAARQWAKDMNDSIAQRVAAHPDHYAAFAHLPLTDPDASADEMERAVTQLKFSGALVTGATDGRYLDHPSFAPILSRAEKLDVPIYLHPSVSSKPVREAYYGGLPDKLGFLLSASGWGWHVDTAIHVLRLLISGAFDRHPKLKIIIGHLGEGLQVMLPRLDQQFHDFVHDFSEFKGMPSAILREHVYVSMSGFFFLPSFMATLDAFGPDRILFSVDYPFGSLERGREFLEKLPVDDETLAKIAHGNADRLLKLL
jgi:predicted TIM-barrel fold metal-dependent hydrolase